MFHLIPGGLIPGSFSMVSERPGSVHGLVFGLRRFGRRGLAFVVGTLSTGWWVCGPDSVFLAWTRNQLHRPVSVQRWLVYLAAVRVPISKPTEHCRRGRDI